MTSECRGKKVCQTFNKVAQDILIECKSFTNGGHSTEAIIKLALKDLVYGDGSIGHFRNATGGVQGFSF